MKALLFLCFITIILSGCYTEYRYPKKRVVVYKQFNVRNNYKRPLYYTVRPNMRFVPYTNNNRFKARKK